MFSMLLLPQCLSALFHHFFFHHSLQFEPFPDSGLAVAPGLCRGRGYKDAAEGGHRKQFVRLPRAEDALERQGVPSVKAGGGIRGWVAISSMKYRLRARGITLVSSSIKVNVSAGFVQQIFSQCSQLWV